MIHDMPKRKPRVREAAPVQVYLDPDAQDRLERLSAQLEATRSEVLRRGLEALEQDLLDPASHPALRIIGLATARASGRMDPALEHDWILADTEERSWKTRGR